MNNEDRYTLLLRRSPKAAAALAIEFAQGCSSKRRAWYWAEMAGNAVPELRDHMGDLSWPELDRMQNALDGGA